MKRSLQLILALVTAALAAIAALPAAAEGALVLENAESMTLYFVLDPPQLVGLDAAGPGLRLRLAGYFLEDTDDFPFQAVLPGRSSRMEALEAGHHLLVGFFAPEGTLSFPVILRDITLEEGRAETGTAVRREPSLLSMQAGEGRLWRFSPVNQAARLGVPAASAAPPGTANARGAETIRIDQQYDDWRDIPSLALFSRIFEPASFTRERHRELQVLPLSASRYWMAGGTQLNEIKAVNSGPYLYFFISTQSAFTDGMCVYLYFHPDGEAPGEENRTTLEIAPEKPGKPGLALMWERTGGSEDLQPIGRLVSGNFFMEGRIDRQALYRALGENAGPGTFFDVTTCYFDPISGTYEEFYFTSIYLRDIPFLN